MERRSHYWFLDFVLILVLLVGAYFRFTGLLWGEEQFLHPDERFLVWVGADITPMDCLDEELSPYSCPPDQRTWMSPSEYFDSARSTLNPNNVPVGGFFVYGTLPLFTARFLVEWAFGHSGWSEMVTVGRALSATADLLAVALAYMVATRLYNRRVGILAAAFSAAAVMQIQQSHFFTMDNFVTLFTLLALYFAVRVLTEPREGGVRVIRSGLTQDILAHDHNPGVAGSDAGRSPSLYSFGGIGSDAPAHSAGERAEGADTLTRAIGSLSAFVTHPLFWPSIGFGLALGMAVASKLNAAPVAIVLPAAMLLRLAYVSPEKRWEKLLESLPYLFLAAVLSLITFRIFQPYAFTGPGFFGFQLNPSWLAQIREQRAQSNIYSDFPPAMQWARRPVWFSFQNMVLWGLGLPLGVLAWTGFFWAGWRILTTWGRSPNGGEWQRHLLLWTWTGLYFAWQSLALNPTMRYQLPIYPTLAIFAAWAVVALNDKGKAFRGADAGVRSWLARNGHRTAAVLIAAFILISTYVYAYAFTRIYSRSVTRIEATRWILSNVPGPINVQMQTEAGERSLPIRFPYEYQITPGQPYFASFQAPADGLLEQVYFPHLTSQYLYGPAVLRAEVSRQDQGGEPLVAGSVPLDPSATASEAGMETAIGFEEPLVLEEGGMYFLSLELSSDQAVGVELQGAGIANEGEWDDGLPLRMDGYDPFGGIYPLDLNFNMYWDDTTTKLARFERILASSDYIVISSSRQWGSLPRIPERFPMTTLYYRTLIGCPPERTIEWCYNVAEPGTFEGELGFDLVHTFTSNPGIKPLEINDQFAEEAFTVYDHPKVFIFQKSDDYSPEKVSRIFSVVDFDQVIRVAPMQAGSYPANLLLPPGRLAEQKQGGTWSRLFDTEAVYNKYPALGAVIWYLSVFLLGLIVYPLLRFAWPGLPDKGYPLARIAGLLLLSWLVWVAGSYRIPFTGVTISAALGMIALVGILLAFVQREGIAADLRSRKKYFLFVEALFLAFFLLDIVIRLGNPDLWHPWRGGEKPMDFAYFNAVIKSTTFPPYDPWYAGGYLNYYYYGFVFAGVLVKWLGIVPSIAYNLILPTIFSMIALGAFSLVWNLLHRMRDSWQRYGAAFGGAIGMALLGNLGTVRMIWQGYQRLAAPGGNIANAALIERIAWSIQGFFQVLGGANLPFQVGEWYWIPSRAIPSPGDVEPITEFPFFTVLYADPHAHLFAMPIALLAVGFALAMLLGRARWRNVWAAGAAFFLGGLAIGALRPTNTWDLYTYLALGAIASAYAVWNGWRSPSPDVQRRIPWLQEVPETALRALAAGGAAALVVALAVVLYTPYVQWYGQGYGEVQLWQGQRTPTASYLVHWSVFLFFIVSWMLWETREWMASTPVSSLNKLRPYQGMIIIGIAALVTAILALWIMNVWIAWLVIPLATWAGVLLLRPGLPDTKRAVLFLIGTGLTLTLVVELVVLVGDIARMNTVFKFYLQVWTLFAVSAGAAAGWLLQSIQDWLPRWRSAWQFSAGLLVLSAALFPLLGGLDKMRDRMAPEAPNTLDGAAFMPYAVYHDEWGAMPLDEDYAAMRWMQENVEGSPVIVEANLRALYHWGSRISNYTGLPGVVGWEWHQQQQRTILPHNLVSQRIAEIDAFYQVTDLAQAKAFLDKYDVRYIVLGRQEQGHYPGPGLEKFPDAEGLLWREVFRTGSTVIYEVIPTS